jgi:hypothetical protein
MDIPFSKLNIKDLPEGIADDLINKVLDLSADNFRPLNKISHILNMYDKKTTKKYPSYIIYKFIHSFIYYCLLTNKLYVIRDDIIIKNGIQYTNTIINKLSYPTKLPLSNIIEEIKKNFIKTIIEDHKFNKDINESSTDDEIEKIYNRKVNGEDEVNIRFNEPVRAGSLNRSSIDIHLQDAINFLFITKNNEVVLNLSYMQKSSGKSGAFKMYNGDNLIELDPIYRFIDSLETLLTTHFADYLDFLDFLDKPYKEKLLTLIKYNERLYLLNKELNELLLLKDSPEVNTRIKELYDELYDKLLYGGNNMYYINCDNIKKIYITYSNKKVYLYKNENNIFITINKKILYINKKILGFDKKLNKYFIKI